MSRHILTLTKSNRAKAIVGVTNAPDGFVLELREPKRSDEQNAALWGLLNQIQRQRPKHNGVNMTAELWKTVFMDALGAEMRMLPKLDGDGFFPIGHSTSRLTKGEFADLLTIMLAWCAREGLRVEHFGEPTGDYIDAEFTEVKAITDGREAVRGQPGRRAA
jgi:hypothetical protein